MAPPPDREGDRKQQLSKGAVAAAAAMCGVFSRREGPDSAQTIRRREHAKAPENEGFARELQKGEEFVARINAVLGAKVDTGP